MKTIPVIALVLAFCSAALGQALPDISEQTFETYEDEAFGLGIEYPTIGFMQPDLPPFPEGRVYYTEGTEVFLRFRVYTLTDFGPPEFLDQVRNEMFESGKKFLLEDFDHNGTLFGWSGEGRRGLTKVVFRENCPLAAVLRLAYPEFERAKMEAYFGALAMSFVLGPSTACPAPNS